MKIPACPSKPWRSGVLFIKNIKRNIGKLFFSIGLVLVLSFLLTGTSTAQANTSGIMQQDVNSTQVNSNINSDVTMNSHNAIQILFIEFLASIQCQLSGTDPLGHGNKCLGVDRETGKIGFVENGGGAIVAVGSLIDALFIPPASGIGYMAHMKNNFGITKPTYAQTVGQSTCLSGDAPNGIGFCAIEPLLPIWRTMRNIVYLLFILVFIVIGIGIMLRIHIDPRTVMTIQNQIPKIIVGLVAISFSFAIAGFLIDVMYVAIYLFLSTILQAAGTDLNADSAVKISQATDPFTALNYAWQAMGVPGEDFGIYHIAQRTATVFSSLVTQALTEFQPGLGLLWDILGTFLGILATVILFIALLILLIRLFIVLLLAFINIILDIIFAPWWILAGLFPGGPLGLGAWIRDLISNLAVFPLTIGFMLLGAYLMNIFYGGGQGFGLNFPLLGYASNGATISALIGFGFILMLPNLLTATKAALKTPNINFGPLFGPIGSAAGPVTGTARGLTDEFAHGQKGKDGKDNLIAKGLYVTGIAKRRYG